jgi:uncharacterized protein YkwD
MKRIFSVLLLISLFSCQKESEILSENISENTDYLTLVNEIRTQGCKCGTKYFTKTSPIQWNTTLENVGLLHSIDMAKKKYFSHISPDGTTPGSRILKSGYNWKFFGENIFMTTGFSPSNKEVIDAWKNSPTHCENMMNPSYKEMGIGVYNNYFTQVFASK